MIFIQYSFWLGLFLCVLLFGIGIFFVLFFDYFLSKKGRRPLYQLGILSMIALMFHNLPEGIATYLSAYQDIHLGLKLSVAIMLHNIPEGISIAVPIYYATKSRKNAIFKTFLSGLVEPLGAFLAYLFLAPFISDVFISGVLLFVAGMMITLSIQKMFPEAISYQENRFVVLGLILGIVLILINHFVF